MTSEESALGMSILLVIAIIALILRDRFHRSDDDPDVIEVWPLYDDDEENDDERGAGH